MTPLAIGRSLCWRGRGESAEIDSYTRIVEEADGAWLMTANASRGGFENTSPLLTRGLLDRASEAIQAASVEKIEDRFKRTFEACQTFIRAQAGKEDYEVAAGALSVVHVTDAAVHVRWLGGEETWMVRRGRLDARTLGHTMSRRGEQTDVMGLAFGRSKDGESLTVPWGSVEVGRVVLLTRTLVEALAEENVIRCVEAGSVQDSAKALIEQFRLASRAGHGAVIVVERSR